MPPHVVVQEPCESLNGRSRSGPYLPVGKETAGDGKLTGESDIRRDTPHGESGGNHGGWGEQSADRASYVPVLARFATKRATFSQSDTQTHTRTISTNKTRFSVYQRLV